MSVTAQMPGVLAGSLQAWSGSTREHSKTRNPAAIVEGGDRH
jgi:hypothetical protein